MNHLIYDVGLLNKDLLLLLTSPTESCAWCAPRARGTKLEVRSAQLPCYLRAIQNNLSFELILT